MPDAPVRSRGPFAGLPREVAILSAVSFTVALGFGIVSPSIPAFARQFGVSAAAAASVISAFAFVRILGALPGGRLVDRFGQRLMIAIGCAVVGVSSILAGFSGSFVQLIVLRGVGGLGSVLFGIGAQTLLLSSVGPDQRGRASGLYTGGFLLGGISGPAIGGLIAAWSLRAPFFIYGVMLAIPAAIAFTALRDRPRQEEDGPVAEAGGPPAGPASGQVAGQHAGLARTLRNRAYQAAAGANLADGFAVLGVRSAIVPLFVKEVLHRSPTVTGIGFGVVAVLNAAMLLPAGRVADKAGRRPVVVTGCLVSAASMVVLAFVPGLRGFMIAMVTLGLGSGMLDVAPSAMVGDLLGNVRGGRGQGGTGRGAGGTLVAAYQMAGDIGAVTGPVAVGYFVDSISYGAAFLLAAAVLAAAGVLALTARETTPRPALTPRGELIEGRPDSSHPACAQRGGQNHA
ncbi:MAG TPA: MFS transporter [Streptosporangiaceae bacterium]|nr:MFS transporter [Streptosporangiaceae bacterium]